MEYVAAAAAVLAATRSQFVVLCKKLCENSNTSYTTNILHHHDKNSPNCHFVSNFYFFF